MTFAIRYFSGTGNTERAVGVIAEVLKARGAGINLMSIEEGPSASSLNGADAFILAFPTYSFVPPAIVSRFIRALPPGRDMLAYVLACDGGGSYTAPGFATRALRQRGFDVSLALSASYAENWTQFLEPPCEDEQGWLTAQGDAMAREFAMMIVSGERRFQRAGLLGLLLGPVGALYLLVGRRFLGKVYIADAECVACGLCELICPVACIVMHGKGKAARPLWRFNCEGCNRCINLCPERAINVSIARLALLSIAAIGASWAFVAVWASFGSILGIEGVLHVAVDAIAYSNAVLLGHALALGPFDFALARVQGLPRFSRLFGKSFAKAFRRYRAPGYKPRTRRGKGVDAATERSR